MPREPTPLVIDLLCQACGEPLHADLQGRTVYVKPCRECLQQERQQARRPVLDMPMFAARVCGVGG